MPVLGQNQCMGLEPLCFPARRKARSLGGGGCGRVSGEPSCGGRQQMPWELRSLKGPTRHLLLTWQRLGSICYKCMSALPNMESLAGAVEGQGGVSNQDRTQAETPLPKSHGRASSESALLSKTDVQLQAGSAGQFVSLARG